MSQPRNRVQCFRPYPRFLCDWCFKKGLRPYDPFASIAAMQSLNESWAHLAIPVGLVAGCGASERQFKDIFRMAIALGWEATAQRAHYIKLDQCIGEFVFHGPSVLSEAGDILLYVPCKVLQGLTRDQDHQLWFRKFANASLEAMPQFWFCLSYLAADVASPIYHRAKSEDAERLAENAIPQVLKWWSVFCKLSHRFTSGAGLRLGWPLWGNALLNLCLRLGMSDDLFAEVSSTAPSTAGSLIEKWYRSRV